MYADTNFKTKKALREAVKDGAKVGIFQPNNIFGVEAKPLGRYSVEGPHYPSAHTWYATVVLDEEGYIKKIS